MSVAVSEGTDREQKRLAALASYEVLDTPREPEFDDIARLASDICGTPIAVVNLIADRRQFFKAEVGLGVRETPFESSFCAKAILEEDFLIVPDASQDPRFDCNPLVTGEPHLRFYAGALLKTEEGLPIGTMCVLDFQPRELTELQQRTLRVLARQVMTQLELRRMLKDQAYQIAVQRRLGSRRKAEATRLVAENEQIRLDEERLRIAQHAGGIGIFEVDIAAGEVEVSEEFCRIFGLPPQRSYPAAVLEALVVKDDETLRSDHESRSAGTAKLDVEYRIRRKDDSALRWIARRARFVTDATGDVTKMVGVVIDITDSKQRDVRAAALLSLGDRLREVSTIEGASRIAAEVLAQGLAVDRTGYSRIDHDADAFVVEFNWTAPNVTSIAGHHPLRGFAATVQKLLDGETLALPNVSTTDWLGDDAAGYQSFGVRSFLKVPILEHNRLAGVLFAHDGRPRAWSKDEMEFAWGVADRTYAALGKIGAEDQQRILNQELSHRLKNTLAIVQAIATQTLKNVSERDAVDAFSARLQALSAAHEVLLNQSWSRARMRAVIEKVLAIHAEPHRIRITGPDVPLGPKAGLSLSLIFHELGTNAVKYGALSSPDGLVDVSWDVHGEGDEATLTLRWQERQGPAVVEPTRKGFGSRLIRMGIAGTGDVDKRYEPTGLVAVLRAPMSLIQEIGE